MAHEDKAFNFGLLVSAVGDAGHLPLYYSADDLHFGCCGNEMCLLPQTYSGCCVWERHWSVA